MHQVDHCASVKVLTLKLPVILCIAIFLQRRRGIRHATLLDLLGRDDSPHFHDTLGLDMVYQDCESGLRKRGCLGTQGKKQAQRHTVTYVMNRN